MLEFNDEQRVRPDLDGAIERGVTQTAHSKGVRSGRQPELDRAVAAGLQRAIAHADRGAAHPLAIGFDANRDAKDALRVRPVGQAGHRRDREQYNPADGP